MAGQFPQQEFGQLGSQARLANIAREKRTDYWAGTMWACRYQAVNGAAGGTMTIVVVPGEDNEMEVLYGIFENLDPTARVLIVQISDEDGERLNQPVNAINTSFGARQVFPQTDEASGGNASSAHARWIVAGTMRFEFIATSIAISEDVFMGMAARIRGDKPVVTLEAADPAATLVQLSDRVY